MPSSSQGLPAYTNEDDVWMENICAGDYCSTGTIQQTSPGCDNFPKDTPRQYDDQDAIRSVHLNHTIRDERPSLTSRFWTWQGTEISPECPSNRGSFYGLDIPFPGDFDHGCSWFPNHTHVTSQFEFPFFQTYVQPHELATADCSQTTGLLEQPNSIAPARNGCSVADDKSASFDGLMPVNENHWGAYETYGDENKASFPDNGMPDRFSMNNFEDFPSIPTDEEPPALTFEQLGPAICLNNDAPFIPSMLPGSAPLPFVQPWSPPRSGSEVYSSPISSICSNAESTRDNFQPFARGQTYSPGLLSSTLIVDPPDADMEPTDAQSMPRKQDLKHPDNLYLPKWVRGHGRGREAWCGDGCQRWLSLKRSTYWYHKNFIHGITVTGQRFPGPVQTRFTKDNSHEGLCSTCNKWIQLGGSRGTDTSWFRHVYKCGSMAALRHSHHKPQLKGTFASSASPERRKPSNTMAPSGSTRRPGSL